jgi:hypothetical protein
LIAENATQALCRDIFVESMLRLEGAGYYVVAHTHDEFVCEVPEGFGNLEEFLSIIEQPPAWAPDFPIAAKGRIADRLIEIKEPKQAAPTDDNAEVDNADDENESHAPPIFEEPPQIEEPTLAFAEETPPQPPPPPQDTPPPSTDEGTKGNGHATDGFGAHDSYASGEQPRGTSTTRYIYKDAHGKLYMRVKRTDAKTFPTSYWHNGRWMNGWPATVIPYRLPELVAAPASEPVWICEGEKDCDNVAALGLIATTNPGGAGKWQPELTQWFAGKQLVYLLEDNDDAGRKHTAKVAAALRSTVPEIVTVSFPELPEKGDVSDWLEAGGNRRLLIARAQEARKRDGAKRTYVAVKLSTVKPRATKWIWPGHLARGALELLAGIPGLGKSQIQCQYVACVTTGHTWPDDAPGIEPCRVIMLTAEDTTDTTLVPRLKAAGANLELVEELRAIHRNAKEEMFLLAEDMSKLEQMIRDRGDVGLVTVDPITAFMGHAKHFDSHRATDVRAQLSPLKKLAEDTNVALSAVTHPSKNAGPRALDHFLGSQAFIAAARLGHLCVPEMEDTPDGAKRATGRNFYTKPKHNITGAGPTLVYRMEMIDTKDCDEETGVVIRAPVIRWEGEMDITADEAIAAARTTKSKSSLTAQGFLTDFLAGGPQLQTAVIERGAERRFTEHQLKHAKTKLAIVSYRKGFGESGVWFWALPQHAPEGAREEEE